MTPRWGIYMGAKQPIVSHTWVVITCDDTQVKNPLYEWYNLHAVKCTHRWLLCVRLCVWHFTLCCNICSGLLSPCLENLKVLLKRPVHLFPSPLCGCCCGWLFANGLHLPLLPFTAACTLLFVCCAFLQWGHISSLFLRKLWEQPHPCCVLPVYILAKK